MGEYSRKEWINIIHESIMDELADGAYYRKMAAKASDYEARDMLLGMAADEERHAKELIEIHEHLCGCPKYRNPVPPQPAVGDYKSSLEVRFYEEIKAAKKYKEYYLHSHNDRLRDLWFDLMTDEERHASCILYLMHKNCLKEHKHHQPCSCYEGLDYSYNNSTYNQYGTYGQYDPNYPLPSE